MDSSQAANANSHPTPPPSFNNPAPLPRHLSQLLLAQGQLLATNLHRVLRVEPQQQLAATSLRSTLHTAEEARLNFAEGWGSVCTYWRDVRMRIKIARAPRTLLILGMGRVTPDLPLFLKGDLTT